MSYNFVTVHFFPAAADATRHITAEAALPQDMREYLEVQPTQGRMTGDWTWNAPQDVKRSDKEHGYAFAYTNLGMGHWRILYWNHDTNLWHVRLMGGENGHSATARYTDWLENGFGDEGTAMSIQQWMDKFQADASAASGSL